MEAVLRELTLGDLRDWAGGKILGRARPYVSHVQQLSRTPEQALAAWVVGTDRYATSVRLPERGEYVHACSCPYDHGGPCKHAVALLLAAGEALKAGQAIPALDPYSDLAQRLRGAAHDDAFGDDAGEDEDDGADDEDDAGRHGGTARAAPRRAKPTRIAAVLDRLDRDGLQSLLLALAAQYPEVARGILEADQLAGGRIDSSSVRCWPKSASSAPSRRGTTAGMEPVSQPDYSRLAAQVAGAGQSAAMRTRCCAWERSSGRVVARRSSSRTTKAIPPWR